MTIRTQRTDAIGSLSLIEHMFAVVSVRLNVDSTALCVGREVTKVH